MIRKFYRDRGGYLWLASNRLGLGGWQQDQVKFYSADPRNHFSISSNNVFDIQEDAKGNLWVSTYGGGLNYFDKAQGTFAHIR